MNSNLILLILLLKKQSPKVNNLLTQYLQVNSFSIQIDNVGKMAEQQDIIEKIHELIEDDLTQITTMNEFHKIIGKILRDLKQSQKVQSGSVVDLFARNMLLLFNQMDFNQLIKAWEEFETYKQNYLQNNPFLQDSHLDYVLQQLQECSSLIDLDELKNILDQQALEGNMKVHYLKALYYGILRYPFKAIKHSRKFYDLSLHNLVPKKVNHCIMNTIQLNMKMNFYDEALNSLSEGLRLSQTVSDELSINLCLLNLYEIAYRNNYQKQSTLLLEYAVNHAQQLSAQHKLQNCLIYGAHIRYRKLHHSLLKKKNINWKDIIHQSLKQLLQSYSEEIQSALQSYTTINAVNYGNNTLVDIALEQLQLYEISDITIQQKLGALDYLVLSKPLDCLYQLYQIVSNTANLSGQMALQIINICYQLFEQQNDKITLKYLQQWAENILDITPDPYYSESLNLSEAKHPKIKCKQLLQEMTQDLEIIKLCKDFDLEQQYLAYKLNIIQELINENQVDLARDKLKQINLNKFSQSNCEIKAKYWNLMGRLETNPIYYKNSISYAIQISNLSMIRENYYDLAILFDQENNELERDYCSEQFNKCEQLIQSCSQNGNLSFYKCNLLGIIEYLMRYLEIVNQELEYSIG